MMLLHLFPEMMIFSYYTEWKSLTQSGEFCILHQFQEEFSGGTFEVTSIYSL